MCGINGIIYKNHKPSKSEVYKMNYSINHRGPDGSGVFEFENVILGHVRLAILDLSPKGKQPMSCDERYWITFNGEIYNFKSIQDELKKLGHKFYSKTDTEVILKAYIEWGEECFHKFNGMWSLAILDTKKREVILSRDRYGVKPCYYYRDDGKFIFSSEIKGIYVTDTDIELDRNKTLYTEKQLSERFSTRYKNINILPPGHLIKVDLKNLNISKYRWWKCLDHIPKIDMNYQKAKENIKTLLNEAIKIRLTSDVKIATSLSGGIDSGIIFAELNKNFSDKNIDLNPFIFKDNNICFDNALELSSLYKKDPYVIEDISYKPEDFKKLYGILESPESFFSQIQIYKNQKKHGLKVSIDGHGADECLGGYIQNLSNFVLDHQNNIAETYMSIINGYGQETLNNLVSENNFVRSVSIGKINLLDNMYRPHKDINQKYHEYFDAEELNLIPDFFLEDQKQLEEYGIGQRVLIADANYGGLQWLLNKWDKASMANSVEIRSPFLDYNFFQYSLALPDAFRIKGGKNKAILRDAYEDILSPLLVSDKRKQGLSAIKNNYDNSYLEYTHDLYSNLDFLNSDIWNGKKISADFESAKKIKALDKIEQLDVFFRLYEMNNGFLEIKKDANQNQADESDFINKPINDYNILN
jgi:asparagine synthase (glutamine-hydrolysing)